MSAPPLPTRARPWSSRLRPWRKVWGIVRLPAAAAAILMAVGWIVGPIVTLALTVVIAAIGVPAAIIHSAFLLGRRSRLPRLRFRHEARRVAAVVALLLLLVPANGIPTAGKRRLLKWQGRAAVRALEAHYREHGTFPKSLSGVDRAPLLRNGIGYRSSGDDYYLWFDNPDWRVFDTATWEWDRTARAWRLRVYRF